MLSFARSVHTRGLPHSIWQARTDGNPVILCPRLLLTKLLYAIQHSSSNSSITTGNNVDSSLLAFPDSPPRGLSSTYLLRQQ